MSGRCLSDTRNLPGFAPVDGSARRTSPGFNSLAVHRRRALISAKVQRSSERGKAPDRLSGPTRSPYESTALTSRSRSAGAIAAPPLNPQNLDAAEPSSLAATNFDVREALPEDYWSVADVHCMSFYPSAEPPMLHFLRLDRVLALHLGRMIESNRRVSASAVQCRWYQTWTWYGKD
eukprot:scaffold48703_cov41-Prasinocladus_malaysianus.AAC.1